ncbi:MAG: hypothetical protein IPK53_03230, partial [bacterium]|nr:hypothetical protein [bacterium]
MGTTVNALVEQAAASVETDPLGALTTAFRDALKDAKTAVESVIRRPNKVWRLSPQFPINPQRPAGCNERHHDDQHHNQ